MIDCRACIKICITKLWSSCMLWVTEFQWNNRNLVYYLFNFERQVHITAVSLVHGLFMHAAATSTCFCRPHQTACASKEQNNETTPGVRGVPPVLRQPDQLCPDLPPLKTSVTAAAWHRYEDRNRNTWQSVSWLDGRCEQSTHTHIQKLKSGIHLNTRRCSKNTFCSLLFY